MTIFADIAAAMDPLVSNRFWLDDAVPENPTLPYASFSADAFSTLTALSGDARTTAWSRLAQVDIWQAKGTDTETMTRNARTALNGLKLNGKALRVRVESVVRAPESRPTNLIHDAITIRVAELE